MNINEAVKESLITKRAISRRVYENRIFLIPTNDSNSLVALCSEKRLPCRGWQPFADDLIADDWYVTDISYEHSILDYSKRSIRKAIDNCEIYS